MENDWAALTVAEMMPDVETLQLAMRYAVRIKRTNLASRVGEIALKKEEGAVTPSETDGENEEERHVTALLFMFFFLAMKAKVTMVMRSWTRQKRKRTNRKKMMVMMMKRKLRKMIIQPNFPHLHYWASANHRLAQLCPRCRLSELE